MNKRSAAPPPAVVMNLFYTGLGIARSLGERGIPVIGLTAQKGVYGNYTRHAKTVFSPDSRSAPEELIEFLLELGEKLGRAVIFPTRDDDVMFLDRFREKLTPHFSLVMPESAALKSCLSKWETYVWAQRAGVPAPKCWQIEREQDLVEILDEVTYPCVLKPLAAHHWRQGGNWDIVGGRKAIGVSSKAELLAEYATVARADARALLQEMVPGGDDCLVIAACYLDRNSDWVAGFNTQKVVQSPETFGTGCIVKTVERPELFAPTLQLLKAMRYTGIAEVEYKWDAAQKQYKLIEVNPRPWDQHTLGKACGTDLIPLAYCEHAGLPMTVPKAQFRDTKWIAEDAFIMLALQLFRRRDPKFRWLLRMARGHRTYAIWSVKDPLPLLGYLIRRFIPFLFGAGLKALWSMLTRRNPAKRLQLKKGFGL